LQRRETFSKHSASPQRYATVSRSQVSIAPQRFPIIANMLVIVIVFLFAAVISGQNEKATPVWCRDYCVKNSCLPFCLEKCQVCWAECIKLGFLDDWCERKCDDAIQVMKNYKVGQPNTE